MILELNVPLPVLVPFFSRSDWEFIGFCFVVLRCFLIFLAFKEELLTLVPFFSESNWEFIGFFFVVLRCFLAFKEELPTLVPFFSKSDWEFIGFCFIAVCCFLTFLDWVECLTILHLFFNFTVLDLGVVFARLVTLICPLGTLAAWITSGLFTAKKSRAATVAPLIKNFFPFL